MRITIAVLIALLPATGLAAEAKTIRVTPDTISQHDLVIDLRVTPRTMCSEGGEPMRVIDHQYDITVKSEKRALDGWCALLLFEKRNDCFVLARLASTLKKDGSLWFSVAVSPELLDQCRLVLREPWRGGVRHRFNLSLKEFADSSEPSAPADR